ASSTRTPSGTTSLPMPSPGMTATRYTRLVAMLPFLDGDRTGSSVARMAGERNTNGRQINTKREARTRAGAHWSARAAPHHGAGHGDQHQHEEIGGHRHIHGEGRKAGECRQRPTGGRSGAGHDGEPAEPDRMDAATDDGHSEQQEPRRRTGGP